MQIVKRKRVQATPHLHIDFIPFTTGSKRGLETRVSLKKALEALGFPLNMRYADTTEGSQLAYFHSSALARRRLLFRLPGGWQVGSDRPFCRSLGSGQTTTVLQSSFLLKTCCYRDKIFVYSCCAVPLQRLFKSFWAVWGIAKQDARKSLRTVMYDKWATAALPKNGSRPRVVRRTI